MGVSRFITRSLLAAGTVAATALVPLVPQASAAEPAAQAERATTGPEQADREISALELRVTPGTRTAESRTALLHCDPAGGTHPEAAAACEQLDAVQGRLGSLRAGKEKPMCPLVYRPVTVKATGTWKNSPVQYSQKYSNSCEMKAYTGAVFNF
ncbi:MULTISPECIES: SSI family serine proteinase inhibitor [unclassified Actinopolyspora]|uniref:SSI family serine proteinase inhibitor n=1 Tax=unclassified Actinopolyspora TaxID=2639451 RepID=UPI0013F69CEA|nr:MULTISPECIES: SSI family serine proteinase inhibitor [unclassified Actinopolyspora]NHD18663.1 protease inhibitor [Actinopolyspora sp. BKK2]NHE78015.1 protease inhibitor [Actinopolyspora sp. BKK1]